MAAVVSGVQLSNNLLPPRTPSLYVKHSQPMIVGSGIALHYVKEFSKVLLVKDNVALGVVSLVAEVINLVCVCCSVVHALILMIVCMYECAIK